MSGGVDSSVAALLLKEQGYNVIGVTMKVWPQDCVSRAEDKCCGPQAVADARGVAPALGIPHYVLDFEERIAKVSSEVSSEASSPELKELFGKTATKSKRSRSALETSASRRVTKEYRRRQSMPSTRPSGRSSWTRPT